jgi:hypothetical protein
MCKIPTDREILRSIYDRYYQEYIAVDKTSENGSKNKMYVPIDCAEIAKDLNVDVDLIYGRFFYHLNEKYSIELLANRKINLFKGTCDKYHNNVYFPLLTAILAELEESQLRFFTMPVILSVSALILSVINILFF